MHLPAATELYGRPWPRDRAKSPWGQTNRLGHGVVVAQDQAQQGFAHCWVQNPALRPCLAATQPPLWTRHIPQLVMVVPVARPSLLSASVPAGVTCALPRRPRAQADPGSGPASTKQRHHPRSVRTHGTWPGSTNDYTRGHTTATSQLNHSSGSPGLEGPNGNGAPGSGGSGGALQRSDYPKFVQFFRHASPYIAGHRGKTFVIVIPGNITCNRQLLQPIMSDIALLHGLGVRLVVVVGAQNQIDALLKERDMKPAYVGGYRVTDKGALKVAMEAAGEVRTTCEQMLSKGPAIPLIRRHTKGEGEIHFEPALRVISGNFVAAKRRGVLDGVDFGYTGEVRFVLKDDIQRQLESGNVVLLSNLGFTAAGEVLNCNTCDVGLHAAVELGADKLFFLHLDDVTDLHLPEWLPLSDAQDMLVEKLQASLSTEQLAALKETIDRAPGGRVEPEEVTTYPSSPLNMPQQAQAMQASRVASRLANSKREELVVDLDVWSTSGLPTPVSTCVVACCKGIKRAHLLDARLDGGLLLELYSRDGVGTMISADFYEGIRKAGPGDLDAIRGLLAPLEEAGTLVKRKREEVANMLPDFTVIERENKVLGCALLLPLGLDEQGVCVAELGAFCVDPAFRGSGRGDSLLDYVEQEARKRGVQRLVLLTTRTADWFEQRDFKWVGAAYASDMLPPARRSRVNPARNSQLYAKHMEAADPSLKEPGKRIGF